MHNIVYTYYFYNRIDCERYYSFHFIKELRKTTMVVIISYILLYIDGIIYRIDAQQPHDENSYFNTLYKTEHYIRT